MMPAAVLAAADQAAAADPGRWRKMLRQQQLHHPGAPACSWM